MTFPRIITIIITSTQNYTIIPLKEGILHISWHFLFQVLDTKHAANIYFSYLCSGGISCAYQSAQLWLDFPFQRLRSHLAFHTGHQDKKCHKPPLGFQIPHTTSCTVKNEMKTQNYTLQ